MKQISVAERVLGIHDSRNDYHSFAQAYETLTGNPFDPHDPVINAPKDPALQGAWYEKLSRTQQERSIALRDVLDLLRTDGTRSTSTLTDWHHYSSMMDRYGTKADGNARALMIGAFSPLSSRSFQCLASDVYGADTAIIIDPITGAEKPQHGLFVQGDGLALPFGDGSMDFVHTNRLLHMLADPSSSSSSTWLRVRKLIVEMARVLAPGGQIFMHEILSDHENREVRTLRDVQDVAEENQKVRALIARALGRHGIGYVQTGMSETIQGSKKDQLFDPTRDFSKYPKILNALVFTLYARKKATSTARPMPAR